MKYLRIAFAMACLPAFLAAGCVTVSPDSPLIKNKLQMVSAGYTGSMPAENQIANVNMIDLAGDSTWNATCKAKTYLCSSVGTVNGGTTFSCAPVAQ